MKRFLVLVPLLLAACNNPAVTPAPAPAPTPVTPPDVIRAYAVTDDALYNIVLKGNAADEKVMTLSYSSMITDAAQVGNTLYASTFSSLLKIDLQAKSIIKVGDYSSGAGSINALAVTPDGALYAASTGGTLYTVNPTTAALTKVLEMGARSSGDLAFDANTTLYATLDDSASTDTLARITLADKSVKMVGQTGFREVYGLDFQYATLYGRTNAGQLITINTATGAGTQVRTTGLTFTSLN
ncbi:hypothetical protein [Deinococcus sp. UR1]|uniref:hypothetical protein n=1 Tax=Deinococcus sp. UR1 TaxID=1704277 RepID=UPI000C18CF67|nr:hypothetical protein [Deinococcus sp. UR1]PIH00287.1 hypothetical protein AMD26_001585 [Deinococcus sp. UR1]